MPFELLFSHGYTAEFSRSYIMHAIPRNWIQEIKESSCLPLDHTLKGFAKGSKRMPIFSLSFPFLFEICSISFLFLQNKSPQSWWLKKIKNTNTTFYLTASVVQAWFKGYNQGVGQATLFFKLKVIVGRIQFLLALRLRSLFTCWLSARNVLSS